MISILCINLKRRLDKRMGFVGAMFAQDVPMDKIRFFDGYDGINYASSSDVIDDIKLEFPRFDTGARLGVGTWAATLSYLKCLQIIAEEYPVDSKVILMYDHTVFGVSWDKITALIESLPDFNVFQIQSVDIKERLRSTTQMYNSEIVEGVLGDGSSCTVLTPSAAAMTLDLFVTCPFRDITMFYLDYVTDLTKVYAALNPEHYLRRHLNLRRWTGQPDSEREFLNRIKGDNLEETSHFSGGHPLREIPLEQAGRKED